MADALHLFVCRFVSSVCLHLIVLLFVFILHVFGGYILLLTVPCGTMRYHAVNHMMCTLNVKKIAHTYVIHPDTLLKLSSDCWLV